MGVADARPEVVERDDARALRTVASLGSGSNGCPTVTPRLRATFARTAVPPKPTPAP
jgi:hypothetical protein